MINDYETKPLSRSELRLYASIIRKKLNINTIKIPVIELMDILERDYNVEFIIEEDDSFDDGVMAYTYEDIVGHFVIKIRNSVYESACRGNAKCIGFICHEMCHFFLISWFGCKPIYGRTLENKDIERYKTMEWQAKALCGELMIPFDIFKDKPLKEIIIETNSSLLQANYFLTVVCKYN